jgi:hypothetical protein
MRVRRKKIDEGSEKITSFHLYVWAWICLREDKLVEKIIIFIIKFFVEKLLYS